MSPTSTLRAAATRRRSAVRRALGALGAPIAPWSCASGTARRRPRRPGVAVRMLTSGTTGPPKRIDLSYEMLELVMQGAKHYERAPTPTSASATVSSSSTRRWST